MTTRDAHDCDRCGAKDLQEWAHQGVKIGTFSDVPSGRTEDDIHYVDLCLPCCKYEVGAFLRQMAPEQAKAWVLGLSAYKKATP